MVFAKRVPRYMARLYYIGLFLGFLRPAFGIEDYHVEQMLLAWLLNIKQILPQYQSTVLSMHRVRVKVVYSSNYASRAFILC